MITYSNVRIPILSFRSSGVMYYEVNADHRGRLVRSDLFLANAAKLQHRDRYKGIVTLSTKKRMKKAITLLLQSTPYQWKEHPISGKFFQHKISFITLTTPTHENSYNGKWCHKHLLEPMIRVLRRRYGMKSYIWKCELQENGQVHYHLTCDVVLNHTKLRDEWNKLLIANDMLDDFFLKHGHKNPNSTDIHAVYKVKNLEAYLVKYITKEYQNEVALNCKIWDCSKNLKANDYFKIEVDFGISQYIRQLQKSLLVVTHYFEKAIFLDFKTTDYYANFSERIVNEFHKYLNFVRTWEKNETTAQPTATMKSSQSLKGISKSLANGWKGCQLALNLLGGDTFITWRRTYDHLNCEGLGFIE